MKEVLKRFDQLERKLETEVGGLRADVLSRLAELALPSDSPGKPGEWRVTTALLDAVRSNQELASELRQQRLARDERFDALAKRVDALEAKAG